MRIRFLLILFFTLFGIHAQDLDWFREEFAKTPRRKELWEPFSRALEKEGLKAEALSVLRKILKMDALHPFAMGRHAYLLLVWEQRQEEALEAARRTLNYFHSNLDALHTLAWGLYLEKDYATARRTMREIREVEIADYELQYHWALICWKNEKPEEAAAHFRVAARINPHSTQLRISLGLFEEERQKPSQAVRHYSEALKLAPQEGPLRDFLIVKLRTLMPLGTALPQLAENREPSLGEVRDAQSKEDPWARAIARHAPGLQIRPTPPKPAQTLPPRPRILPPKLDHSSHPPEKPVSIPLSVSHLPASTPTTNPFLTPLTQSLPVSGEGIVIKPLNQDQFHRLAEDMLSLGLGEDARMELAAVIALNPSNAMAASARNLMQKADLLSGLSIQGRISGLLQLAENTVRQKGFRLARYILEKALLLSPEDPVVRKNLAWVHLAMARPLLALPILEELNEEYPHFEEASILYGYCLARLRRFKEAASAFHQALQNEKVRDFSREYTTSMLEQVEEYSRPLENVDGIEY